MLVERIERNLFLGFIRLHVLYHAQREPIFGVRMIEELARHGYHIGPGTLYPILHELEQNGLLTSSEAIVDGKRRKYYRATASGESFLGKVRKQAVELVREIAGDSV